MGTPGVRSRRGRGELYEEVKKQTVILLLTPTGRKLLDEKVNSYRTSEGKRLSRGEYFERWARDLL